MSEKREDRWVNLSCLKCKGIRFNVLRHDVGDGEVEGDFECIGCGRIIRVTIVEIAPASLGIPA